MRNNTGKGHLGQITQVLEFYLVVKKDPETQPKIHLAVSSTQAIRKDLLIAELHDHQALSTVSPFSRHIHVTHTSREHWVSVFQSFNNTTCSKAAA